MPTSASRVALAPSRLRVARVGDQLGPDAVARPALRRLDATAVVLPGTASLDGYRAAISAATDDLAAWDGRVTFLEPDGVDQHRVLIVDRYGQVYAAIDAVDPSGLPDAEALEEWFRFLATACPECGVIDDPLPGDWVP
jgi:hypothetical protein